MAGDAGSVKVVETSDVSDVRLTAIINEMLP